MVVHAVDDDSLTIRAQLRRQVLHPPRSQPAGTVDGDQGRKRTMINTRLALILGTVLTSIPIGQVAAQRPTAAITGVVRQAPATAVDGADVIVRNVTTGFEYRGSTSPTGRYWVRGLPPGRYDVTVRRIGMQPASRNGVELAVGRTVTINFVMGTAAVQLEAIEVVATAPLLQTTQSDVANRIDREMEAVLPEE